VGLNYKLAIQEGLLLRVAMAHNSYTMSTRGLLA